MKLQIIILAAGQGTRMRSRYPKVLHQLAGKALLHHVVDTANTLKPDSIFVVYGHPFETIDAAEQIEFLERLFLEDQTDQYYESMLDQGVYEFVLIEQDGSGPFSTWLSMNWQLVFQSGQHQIYQQK